MVCKYTLIWHHPNPSSPAPIQIVISDEANINLYSIFNVATYRCSLGIVSIWLRHAIDFTGIFFFEKIGSHENNSNASVRHEAGVGSGVDRASLVRASHIGWDHTRRDRQGLAFLRVVVETDRL